MCYFHKLLPCCPYFLMATQADIPSGFTDDDKALILQYLDANLNSRILYALLHGQQRRSVSWRVGVD